MIVTLRGVLADARRSGYAVAAFNVTNLETAQAAVGAALDQRSPVILAVSESAARYGGRPFFAALRAMADDAAVPVVIHLDHHVDFELIKLGLTWGASSVMFDGSMLSIADNTQQTKRAVRLARKWRASVEGEVGTIGGQEDSNGHAVHLAAATEAAKFARQTQVDALALGLGTSHGLPVPHETIHLDILDEYYRLAKTPVVLHGASNLSTSLIRAGIRHGVAKINIDTQLRQAFTGAVRDYLTKYEDCINSRDYLSSGRQKMQREASQIIKLFGSLNEAHAVRRYR